MAWPPKIPTMPPLFGDLFRAIIARLDAAWPIDGNGIRVTDAAGGRSINTFGVVGGGNSTAINVRHPFRVTTRNKPESEPPSLQRIVDKDSRLISALNELAGEAIDDLAENDEPPPFDPDHPELDDTGWKDLIREDLIWIEQDFTDGVPTTCAIKSYGAEDEWPDFEGEQSLIEWEGDGSFATPFLTTKSRAIIARTYSDPEDEEALPTLIQVAHTDFVLIRWDVDGKSLWKLAPL